MESAGQTINVMVGTAGHIDHGKTELVKLLTGCDTDRLKEEKQRGMSIDLGFAPCSLADNANVGIVDVPGHERFIRNMVAGASSIDVVLLVVAADDGVMPQTREHLEVVQLLGVKRGLVALTKIDIVDEARRQRAIEQIRELTRGTFLEGAQIAPVSSITAEGFDGFYEALSEVVAQTPRRDTQGVFRLPIERVFAVKGYGTVVTGVPASGQVQLGDQLELIRVGSAAQDPSHRLTCRVRGLQVFGKDTRCGLAGQCVAVNLAQVGSGEIGRGDALVSKGYFQPTQIVTGELSLLSRVTKPLARRTPVALHVGTSERQAKAVLLDRKELVAGDSCPVQFLLDGPIVAGPTDRFVIRIHSPRMTIGGGVVVDTGMPRQRKLSESKLHGFWARRQSLGDPQATVVHLVRQAGSKGISRGDLQYASELK
ncbi:MAG: selenocysteine-specific translation elongation factor, partial [Phycisphaerae bacterium]|nr:selenocysteine-specific translation elongation factor [Phycisphaerae bacterium]